MSPTYPRVTHRHPTLLTKDEEIELAKRIERGNKTALDELVTRNIGLVVSFVNKHKPYTSSMTTDDLIQCGCMGLVKAAERFDWRKGYRFSTFATGWIRQAITLEIEKHDAIIRVPPYLAETLRKIRRAIKHQRCDPRRPFDVDAIVQDTGFSREVVESLMYVAEKPLSLDVKHGDTLPFILDRLPATQNRYNDPEKALWKALESDNVYVLIDLLEADDQQLLQRYYGLKGYTPTTADELGILFKVTGTTIMKRMRRAFAKIKRELETNPQLAELLRE